MGAGYSVPCLLVSHSLSVRSITPPLRVLRTSYFVHLPSNSMSAYRRMLRYYLSFSFFYLFLTLTRTPIYSGYPAVKPIPSIARIFSHHILRFVPPCHVPKTRLQTNQETSPKTQYPCQNRNNCHQKPSKFTKFFQTPSKTNQEALVSKLRPVRVLPILQTLHPFTTVPLRHTALRRRVGPLRQYQGSSLFLHASPVTAIAAQRQYDGSAGDGSGCNHPLPKGLGVRDMNGLPLLARKICLFSAKRHSLMCS